MAEYTQLRGITNSQDVTISNILTENMISFYDWGYLDKGGYYNFTIQPSGGTPAKEPRFHQTTLHPIKNPNFNQGAVWQSNRQNWVWESGVSVGTPVTISGVFVNGVFRATGNTTQPYYIDYKNGQVVFDTAIPLNSTVQISYSAKWINVTPAEGVPWFREVQRFSQDTSRVTQYGSGEWAQLGQTRVQLPTIAVEVIPPKKFVPYQLGGGQWVTNDVLYHVVTENEWECKNIMDQISYQNDRTIYLYDPNKMAASGVSVYDYRGSVTSVGRASGLYPSLVDNFRYKDCYIYDTTSSDPVEISSGLWMGTVRSKTDVRAI